jgi:hypothetical protein
MCVALNGAQPDPTDFANAQKKRAKFASTACRPAVAKPAHCLYQILFSQLAHTAQKALAQLAVLLWMRRHEQQLRQHWAADCDRVLVFRKGQKQVVANCYRNCQTWHHFKIEKK